MTKCLNGKDLADFIKARQASQVRFLRQSKKIIPKLTIFINNNDPVIDTYVRLKQLYGADIGVEVEIKRCLFSTEDLIKEIKNSNLDPNTHGIIVQLPVRDIASTDEVLLAVAPKKDVDGLSGKSSFDSATATAINWLLTGYNIDLKNKKIAIVGAGRLVGAPLYKMWSNSNLNVFQYTKATTNLGDELKDKDLIVSGVGVPGLIKENMVKNGAVIVDAGSASEKGVIVGDVAQNVREREDIIITPVKGGVGPLTIASLFDNVIQAASFSSDAKNSR